MNKVIPVEPETAALYDSLWNEFDAKAFAFARSESEKYFALRVDVIKGKRCLDVGCGVGFFVHRLFAAGAAEVCAVDIGDLNLKNTLHWNERWKNNLLVTKMSAKKLEFPNSDFDYVHSNGVIHHTDDPYGCFKELVRVTKPGGTTTIGVYGAGGLFPFFISVCRVIAKVLPRNLVTGFVKFIFKTPYDRYLVLDFIYVPLVSRYRETEIRRWFKDFGYQDVWRSSSHSRYKYDSFFGRLLHGDGYITMTGRKGS